MEGLPDPADVPGVLQRVWLELYRDNFEGALAIVERARRAHPDPRYDAQALKIRGWLAHLTSPEAYAAAYQRYYADVRSPGWLKRLDRELRTWLGRRTRRMVERVSRQEEFRLLEREVVAVGARRILDAGCGEGRVALTLGARHPEVEVEGVEVAAVNVALARKLNRYPNVRFEQGLLEEVLRRRPGAFDLVYSFAVLEHVRDLDDTLDAVLTGLRPGGRVCFSVPMNEFRASGPLPEFVVDHAAGHVRVFTETELRERFGGYPGFALARIPGRWRPEQYPPQIVPVEFGSYFVAFSRP